MAALSTSFFQIRQETDVEKLMDTLRRLQVADIELDYRIPAPALQRIQSSLRTAGIGITSVHNFCPLPLDFLKTGGGGDLFSLSDTRRDEREEAVKRTLKTIDHAHDLEAKAVVLHCGRVEMGAQVEVLYERYRQESSLSEDARQWLAAKLASRDRLKPAHLDALCFSLDRLLQTADRRQVHLGLETRYHYHELPGPEDFRPILEKFEGAPLGYWHDTGHAFVNEKLELCQDGELLERLSDRLIGVHLHDARGLEDHLPPGSGQIDFGALLPYLSADALQVLELRPGTPTDAVGEGLAHMTACFKE